MIRTSIEGGRTNSPNNERAIVEFLVDSASVFYVDGFDALWVSRLFWSVTLAGGDQGKSGMQMTVSSVGGAMEWQQRHSTRGIVEREENSTLVAAAFGDGFKDIVV
ncbi:hypothetical protein R1flu_006931 [Riccia fluitans]|uniref:Uncharacterized protein n=1 Tax=Riccia fluitans TaxID=41844 RepID=A0ABD1Z1I3_9MARC